MNQNYVLVPSARNASNKWVRAWTLSMALLAAFLPLLATNRASASEIGDASTVGSFVQAGDEPMDALTGTAGHIRFSLTANATPIESPAAFSQKVDRLYLFFDYEEAQGEEIGVSVIAPGGVGIFGNRDNYEGEGIGRVEVTGAAVYGRLSASLHATLKASRSAADNLKRASVGLSEYVTQLQANAQQSRSVIKVLKQLELTGAQADDRQALADGVERFAELAAQARAVDPMNGDEIRRLAGEMATAIGEILPKASALETNALATDRMALPVTDPQADQPYDVLLTFEGSPSAAGEFRIYPPCLAYLPVLAPR